MRHPLSRATRLTRSGPPCGGLATPPFQSGVGYNEVHRVGWCGLFALREKLANRQKYGIFITRRSHYACRNIRRLFCKSRTIQRRSFCFRIENSSRKKAKESISPRTKKASSPECSYWPVSKRHGFRCLAGRKADIQMKILIDTNVILDVHGYNLFVQKILSKC